MDKLLYGFIPETDQSLHLSSMLKSMNGISGTALYIIPGNGVSVVVSDLKSSELITDNQTAIVYAVIIEKLFQSTTVIPVRFPSFMESTEVVQEMLKRNLTAIQNNLRKVADKDEFGLKIFCNRELLREEFATILEREHLGNNNEIKNQKNTVYREWLNKKLKEHQTEEKMIAYLENVIRSITELVNPINAEYKFRKMVTETLLLDALFLIGRADKQELIHVIKQTELKYKGLNFVLTGPWPPYNFVDFTVK